MFYKDLVGLRQIHQLQIEWIFEVFFFQLVLFDFYRYQTKKETISVIAEWPISNHLSISPSYPTLRSLQGDVHVRLSWDIRTEEWDTLCLTPERTPKQAICVRLGAPESPTNYAWYFIYMSVKKLNSCQ